MTASLAVDDPILADFAAEVGDTGPVSVRGGGTRWDLGGEVAGGTRVASAPTGIVSHVPDEMTVAVRAGTTVRELHEELALAGQRTALPERPGGTIGGALVIGESSIHRLGRGHVRDSLLQARYVSAQGETVTAGGPTVKNVTGFDLCRLLVGSLGTIGLLAEVILRTRPIPPAATWRRADDADPFAARNLVRTASAILWDGHTTWVHLEGNPDDVAAEAALLDRQWSWSETDEPQSLPPHRWSRRPAALRQVDESPFVAEIGIGTVHVAVPDAARTLDPVAAEINRRIKQQFDPTGRLNPGRDPARR